jgi:lipoprotein NlpI
MRTVSIAIVVIVVVLFSGAARGQWSEDAQKCSETPDPEVALVHCTRAIESGRLSGGALAITLNNRANAYQNKRDYDRAIQDYDQAIRLDPDSALTRNNRGSAYQHKGDYERALQDYDQAIRLDATFAVAFNNRGRAHHFKENYAQAIRDYDQAIELDPDYALAYYNRALARFDQGLYIGAVPDFVRAFNLDPDNPYRAVGLFLAKARVGDADREALASQAKVLNMARWPGPVIGLYVGQMRPESLLEAARDPDPTMQRERQCEAYFYVGQELLLRGQRDAAVRMLQGAVSTGVTSLYEYASARAELRRLGR